MAEQEGYTFCLLPGESTRYVAGPFDVKANTPHYAIEVCAPRYVRNRVAVSRAVLEGRGSSQWAWDVVNSSPHIAFFSVRIEAKLPETQERSSE